MLELEEPGSNARAKLSAEIRAAIAEDRCEAIVLGCAGMADLALSLSEEHGLPVVDGAAAAVKLCEGLFALGLRTSNAAAILAAGEALHRGFFRVRAGLTPSRRPVLLQRTVRTGDMGDRRSGTWVTLCSA